MAEQGNTAAVASLLDVKDLTVTVGLGGPAVVKDLSFQLAAGEMLALVGESGSGKTMAARAVLNLLPPPLIIAQGRVGFDGVDLASLAPKALRRIRGRRIGMVFQEPMVSLNPSMTIGQQMAEGLRLHLGLSRHETRARSIAMLERIQIADPVRCLTAYPHEFSGGMRQRIMLASVMLLKPALLIADEPTTALDTLVQREVLQLMAELTRENGTAVLMISHDLGMVAHYAQRAIVMQEGLAVESGETRRVLLAPQHAYTRRLVDALPRRGPARALPAAERPLLEIENVIVDYPGRRRLFSTSPGKRAVKGVSLTVAKGETLALVGASGSGKTTLARAIVGLTKITSGSIRFRGQALGGPDQHLQRLDLQMIFQDPFSSLDPRQRVGDIVEEPLRLTHDLGRQERHARMLETLVDVGLTAEHARRFPHQLSGGQRQRVAIARALVRRPAFVVADEPVSALDMTVQKQILALFRSLQERYGFACLFVSHDLGAVEQVADRVAVMEDGLIVEEGARDALFDAPRHPYTRALLEAAMLLDRTFAGSGRPVLVAG